MKITPLFTKEMHQRPLLLLALCAVSWLLLAAQSPTETPSKWQFTGALHTQLLVPQNDPKIGTLPTTDRLLGNSYLQLAARRRNFEFGARAELLRPPLPGYEADFRGAGIPHYYAKARFGSVELTAGTFYEQFGSGLILRTYEERSLGIDNSLRGGRAVIALPQGVTLKALAGQQRRYWDTNPAWIYGADAEAHLHDLLPVLSRSRTAITLGASWVTKQEPAEIIARMGSTTLPDGTVRQYTRHLLLPANVGAFDLRAQLRRGNVSALVEYARKSQDPSLDNGYAYRAGSALLVSLGYSRRGMSLLAQAKRSEDMSFRSRRSMSGISSFINHLPAFTSQQTYTLANLYPYATQHVPGEWAWQAEGSYAFARKTPLGGRYGTTLKAHFNHVRSLHRKGGSAARDWDIGSDGWNSGGFFQSGALLFQEWGVALEKRLSPTVKLHLTGLHRQYDKRRIEGKGEKVNAGIGIAEVKWNAGPRCTLRAEAQYLHTAQDQGDWWFGLVEISLLPHLMLTLSDQHNAHVPEPATGRTNAVHYFQSAVAYTARSHRLQLSYGKTRAGYDCAGGVCRYVPAQKGLALSYSYHF